MIWGYQFNKNSVGQCDAYFIEMTDCSQIAEAIMLAYLQRSFSANVFVGSYHIA